MSKIHFIGIGGVGMAALAVIMKGEGHEVTGCDIAESARTRWLESLGIKVFIGHHPNHVKNIDFAVVTPAVHRDNEEFLSVGEKYVFRGNLLADVVSKHNDSIAVCGSHGKTTTSTFIAKLLKLLGENPSWAIGGETRDFPVAMADGKGLPSLPSPLLVGTASPCRPSPLVVEADESDGTLARYHATTLVITNCEYDHPDHFKTIKDYFDCFEKAKSQAKDVIEAWKLSFDSLTSELISILDSLAPHNRINARAAIEVALKRGYTMDQIAKVLSSVVSELPDRRFQFLWDTPAVITDYAHHPTEMKCAIQMARKVCKGKLRVLFQPHRYSRTKALLNDFPSAFEGADEVIICPTYSAFEKLVDGGDSCDLYKVCRERNVNIFLARSCKEAWRHAYFEMGNDDVTLLLGAGDIIKLADDVTRDMSTPSRVGSPCRPQSASFSFFRTGGRTVGGGERYIMGMGSNTLISDLTTDVEYVKNSNPADRPGSTLGISWMAGIPGTIGGWVKMNAGAFGHSISEVIKRVKVDGEWIEKEDCKFSYRSSSIDGVIEDIELIDEIENDGTDYLSRRKKFPPRSCGSVFKNPPGDYAGRLLEEVGAKGMSVGGAHVWQEHANVIYVEEGARSSDILALSQILRNKVFTRFSILLDSEIIGL